jgi:hypothetical protein
MPGKVAIEQNVSRRIVPKMNQVHQRERNIVEDIRRSDVRIEFDGVEQQRPAVHQRNVGQMEIAMAAPDEALPAAGQQGSKQCYMIAAAGIELIDGGGVKSAYRMEFRGVAVDD